MFKLKVEAHVSPTEMIESLDFHLFLDKQEI